MENFNIKKFNCKENIYIKASAGTGKTYTVQQIVAELLRLNPARSLEEILIVTYTEKATGELRDRIRAKIQEVIEKKDYNTSGDSKYLSVEEQEKNFRKQLALVDNAPIFTIHSFCKKTLDEFGFDAKENDNLSLIDEGQISGFLDKWIRDKLPSADIFKFFVKNELKLDVLLNKDKYSAAINKFYLNKKGEAVDSIVSLDVYEGNDITDIEYLIDSKWTLKLADLAWKDNRKGYINVDVLIPYSKGGIIHSCYSEVADTFESKEFTDNLNRLLAEIDAAVQQDKQHTKSASKIDAEDMCKKFLSLPSFEKFCYTDILPKSTWKGVFSSKQITTARTELIDYFLNLRALCEKISNHHCGVMESLPTALFEDQLPKIYMAWNQYKADNKLQSFDDMIRNVREAVCKDGSELKQKLKEKYTYGIIDEFQDTNQKQWDIFSKVFLEGDGNNLCVVGDPKQSIYSFQGADVNVYLSAINQISPDGTKGFQLKNNYRSTTPMIMACNELLSDFFTDGSQGITFEPSDPPASLDQIKPAAKYKGKITEPIWIPKIKTELKRDEQGNDKPEREPISEEEFSEFAVNQILKCCSYDSNKKTNLQIFKKDVKDENGNFILTNVSFSDFAVLCKSRTEMDAIKYAFSKAGIPYNHYKESNLFRERECASWKALLKAISAEDFTGYNRKILSECLFSDFFGVPLAEIQDKKYDRPDSKERMLCIGWKKLAEKRQWALLQEDIFEKTNIEEKFSRLDKLSSLGKMRQIGDYCVQYLYENNCTLVELLNHLELLSMSKEDADEEDGNLVAKGTDFDAVQIMTIHASKGLEFPVVIAYAGLKGKGNKSDGVYFYHYNDKPHISGNGDRLELFTNPDGSITEIIPKIKAAEESALEWKRLFYVAYTRASSVMIMPWIVSKDFSFLNQAFESSNVVPADYLQHLLDKDDEADDETSDEAVDDDGEALNCYIREFPIEPSVVSTYEDKQRQVAEIVATQKSLNKADEKEETEEDKKLQMEQLKKLTEDMPGLNTYKLSYSSLSHGKKEEKYHAVKAPEHEEEDDELDEEITEQVSSANKGFDSNPRRIPVDYKPDNLNVIREGYPKGNVLGEAVHQSFEYAEFERVGSLSDEDTAAGDAKLISLIREKFHGQGIYIDEQDSKGIAAQTARMIWNTLNASLPEINGNSVIGRQIYLKDLADNEHFAELEFNMNPDIKVNADSLKDYFNGFIDLVFVHQLADGKKVYSILDWKTNTLAPENYAEENSLNEYMDEHFSIQRILYSYCLIKWLKQFDSEGRSEAELFSQQFGGIYYAYVRGCKAGTGNGIYAQTWDKWENLEAAFNSIIDANIKGNK